MAKDSLIKGMQDIYNALQLMCLNICCANFKWTGLEDFPTLHQGQLETMLYSRGRLVGFESGGYKFILPFGSSANLSVYGELLEVKPISLNGIYFENVRIHDMIGVIGKTNDILKQNAVLLRNNRLELDTLSLIEPIINRLTYIWQSLGINECLSRARAIVSCQKDMSNNLKNELNRLFGGSSPFAIVSSNSNIRSGDMTNIEVQSWDISYQPQDYWEDFDSTFNLLLTCLGVNNYNTNKGERMIVDEVNANNQIIDIMRDSMLEERQAFCEEMNKLFNTHLKCEKKVEEEMKEEEPKKEEGNDNGKDE